MRLKRAGELSPDVNIVPMVDCVFQLLLFFLIATQVKQPGVQWIALPHAVHPEEMRPGRPPLVVTVLEPGFGKDTPYVVGGQTVDASGLGSVLRAYLRYARQAGQGEPVVRVRADRDAQLRQVQDCLLACRDAGVHQVRIAAIKRVSLREDTP